MTKLYAKGTHPWELQAELPVNELIKKYEQGFAGTYLDTEERDKFTDLSIRTGGYSEVENAAHAFGWADAFAGQLVIPFVHVMEKYPGAWPGPAQAVGDCVSHSDKNAKLGLMVCEVVAGQADEVTGYLETYPEIPALGVKNGAFSTESVYWYRGSNSHGWYCSASANVSMSKSGGVVRKNYPEIDVDLTQYSGRLTTKWGRTPPPQSVTDVLKRNLIRTAARVNTFEAARDLLGQGKFLHTCGSEGFSSTRDKNGVSGRRGSWAHAMANIAADDRDEIKKLYGEPLVLVLNSWGPSWNSGPRDILNSAKYVPAAKKALWESLDIVNRSTGNIMIPKGSFWCKWSEWRRREILAYSGFSGWKLQKLTTLGGELWG